MATVLGCMTLTGLFCLFVSFFSFSFFRFFFFFHTLIRLLFGCRVCFCSTTVYYRRTEHLFTARLR